MTNSLQSTPVDARNSLAPMKMSAANLYQLLEQVAQDPAGSGIVIYDSSRRDDRGYISYKDLLCCVHQEAIQAQQVLTSDNTIALIYFPDHLNSIVEFWSVITAGGIPCICPPLPKDQDQRRKMVAHLQKVLDNPLIITLSDLVPEFMNVPNLRLHVVDTLTPQPSLSVQQAPFLGKLKREEDIAVLMLTSGSTGNPKAVCLQHGQILASLKGKIKHHGTTKHDIFLNWTGLDHVANLTEIHLHATSLAAQQIHVNAADILVYPTSFLEIIHSQKVTYTFAPNFFLASLVRTLESPCGINMLQTINLNGKIPLDLSSLRAFISGGESNAVEISAKLTKLPHMFGAQQSFIRPGFGMTETCAGSIYNAIDCPSYDLEYGAEFCSLGECIDGIKARIVRSDGTEGKANEIGSLELSGPVVFKEYYHDQVATREAFTVDGWFKTGDLGLLDSRGRLRLTGRDKDIIMINGVNYSSQAVEAVIEDGGIPGLTPTYTLAFAYRTKYSVTESLCITYAPAHDHDNYKSHITTAAAISKIVNKYCGLRPFKIISLPLSLLEKSSIGKLSRSKVRRAFEEGQYAKYEYENKATLRDSASNSGFGDTVAQNALCQFFDDNFGTEVGNLGLDSDLFEIGLSSIDILKLKSYLQEALKIRIPVTIFFSQPVIRNLCKALEDLAEKREYDPVTTLQPNGTKLPLFFIHPGMGEALIFMNLARYIEDRPVYALRARGFDGEEYFSSMQEMITTYHQAIKRIQPVGPYAIVGYSFGSIIAFEITKIMEANGEKVQFLAAIDQMPHFKHRARTYDWYEVVLTISFFHGLIEEDYAYKSLPEMRKKTHNEVLDHILGIANPQRLADMGMDRNRLDNWAKLAYQLKVIAWDYDPEGVVAHMNVFYTGPLVGIVKARNMKEWFDDYISKWKSFVKDIKFHEVGGTHRTIISPPNTLGFYKAFKEAMKERGLE